MGNQENKLYHFIEVKGSSINSLTLALHQKGYDVRGSDAEEYFFTQRDFEKSGIPILPFSADNTGKDMIVTAGNVFPDIHEGTAHAIGLDVEVICYYDLIARFIEPYTSIAVTESHGKINTTGLLAHVLSGINPVSYLIGGGTGHDEPDANLFAFGAHGYRRRFLAYSPDYTVITNTDFDRPNYYENTKNVFSAFQTMAHQVKKRISAYGDDEYLRQLESEVPVYYCGVNEKDNIRARSVQRATESSSSDIYHRDDSVGYFVPPTLGHHNIMNALGVITVACLEKFDMQKVVEEMLGLRGVKHRFGGEKVSDIITVDNYAYHPAEIRAAIDDARQKYPDKEIITISQPHTFIRATALMDEFTEALDLADEVFLCNIFGSVRETQGEVHIEDLDEKIQKGGRVITEDNVSPLLDLESVVVVFMGVGDVQEFERVYETLLSNATRNVL